MKSLLIAAAVMLLPVVKDKLEGPWETKPSEKGNVTRVVFKPDNTFEGFVNRKPFVTGKYTFQDDVLTFTDNGCDGKQGVYKVIFFSNEDSLKFECLFDICTERKEGMIRTILGRIKK
jgi:hypothetical protein